MTEIAGINGFGRFGLHLIKYWLDRNRSSNFTIKYINDDALTINDAYQIMLNDPAVSFSKYKIKKIGNTLRFLEASGVVHEIDFTNHAKDDIPWMGKPGIFFECSGKNTVKSDALPFLSGDTKVVVISATSWDPDKTLVYGFNHHQFKKTDKIISYGSCTVNAYLPLAEFINKTFGVINSDVNVIHNIQEYRLDSNQTLTRKFCTLEKSAVHLLDFLHEDNFIVNYTVIPYTGPSMIDFRFHIKNETSKTQFLDILEEAIFEGDLQGLYGMCEIDTGPEVHNCSTYSSILIKENIAVKGNNLYLPAYFDNENSVNRYYDLVNYILSEIS